MRTGPLASGVGHGAILALAAFGLPWMSAAERPPIRVTEVSFVSEADFAAAQTAAAEAGPRDPDAPAAAPVVVEAETLEAPMTPPVPEPAPEAAPPPPPLETSLEPAFDAEAPLAASSGGVTFAPVAPPQSALGRPESVLVAPPRPRPVERVAAEPAPAPEEDPRPAEPPIVTRAVTPEPAPAPPPEPPAASPDVAPPAAPAEAAPDEPSGLVASSTPPLPRRGNISRRPEQVAAAAPAEPQPEPELEPQRQAAAPAAPSRPAAPAAPARSTSLPEGPPITSAERDGLRLAVQRCWVVPAGLRDAQELRVTLAAELTAVGEVIRSSIRLIEPSQPPDGRFQQAFEAAQRALIRCSPYDLPQEKYARWRNIEVVFDPGGMVSW